MAISVDGPKDLETMRAAAGASFEFLSDSDGTLLDLFGIRHSGARPGGGDMAQSASFLVDREGRLAWSRVAENYRVRPHPDEILAAVEHLPSS